ncbi:MAG: 1,4-alpha-glucan branching protein GlgB [Chloroflexaceae bacterium]|nr:1,4-alpha-glucan branching protein GlgB [Chloroflexaceae bacterium]
MPEKPSGPGREANNSAAASQKPSPVSELPTGGPPAVEPPVASTPKKLPLTARETPTHQPIRNDVTRFSDYDVFLFNQGTHYRLYEKMGAHLMTVDGVEGTFFAVWAPNAVAVSVVGDFNQWDRETHPLDQRGSSGLWEGFIPGVGKGTLYKYDISSRIQGCRLEKIDPWGFHFEVPPRTASIVWDLDYTWEDQTWMDRRAEFNKLDAPIAIYEVHIGSWMRPDEEQEEKAGHRFLTYRELAPRLADYVSSMGFTHVEFLPMMEHPFYGSWGYQITGYFAPTSRYGTPQDFMYLVDYLHQRGIGVILDWVPSHFAADMHSLGVFDGTHLYEHADNRKGWHPDWNSFIFNYGRNEVCEFLINNALYWFDVYHIDGLRVDAVASMLYLDYSRPYGEWIPNKYGGKENLEAIDFLRRFNEAVYQHFPGVQTIAEESTSWGMVSRPPYVGGLGFGMKWDMGWMHDTLFYLSLDPIFRKYHHNHLTFRAVYAFTENFVLSLSHDEVVHGKGSLLRKMHGSTEQKFATLRLLLGMMYAQPGKKLLFMGGEFGQWNEWYHETGLDWHLLDSEAHRGVQQWVRDLNRLYRCEPALYRFDCTPEGFEWIDCSDWERSVVAFLRKGKTTRRQGTTRRNTMMVVCNCTPLARSGYRVGAPYGGLWREVLNSDAEIYGGSNMGNGGAAWADAPALHGRPYSMTITLPPLSILFFRCDDVVDQVGETPR